MKKSVLTSAVLVGLLSLCNCAGGVGAQAYLGPPSAPPSYQGGGYGAPPAYGGNHGGRVVQGTMQRPFDVPIQDQWRCTPDGRPTNVTGPGTGWCKAN